MSVISTEELLNSLREIVSGTDDESLAFIENVSDTISDLTSKANGSGEDWKAKYEENDAAWRQRYKDRFFKAKEENENDENDGNDENENKPMNFDDLFTVKE